MALIKRCCCCSLETGTKIVGFIQVILGVILVVTVLIYVSMAVYLRDELLEVMRMNAEAKNVTDIEVEEEYVHQKIAFAYLIIILVVVLIYVLFSALMGGLLLAGVYKKNLGYVKWWVRVKTGLILLAVFWLLLQLLLLLYGMDADLKRSILSLVYDGCLILVVQSYYDEESEKRSMDFVADDFNSVPPPAYC